MLIETLLSAAMLGFAPEASVGGILRAIRMVAPQFGMVHKEKRSERISLPSEPSDRCTLKRARLILILDEDEAKTAGSHFSVNVVSDVNNSTLQIASMDDLGNGEFWTENERGFFTYDLKLSGPITYEQLKSSALMTKFTWIPAEGDDLQLSYRLVLEFKRDDNDSPEIIEQSSSVPISFGSKLLTFTGF